MSLMRRTHPEYNESAYRPLTDMTADMLGVRLRASGIMRCNKSRVDDAGAAAHSIALIGRG